MAKRSKNRAKQVGPRHTGLGRHRKQGTQLVPPLATVPTTALDWERDLLPEHLWIAALLRSYPRREAYAGFHQLLDALDALCPPGEFPLLGLVSDFARVPVAHRTPFLTANADLVERFVADPIGRAMGFYPDCPAAWLFGGSTTAGQGRLDPATEIPRLREMVFSLFPGKDEFCSHVRVFPFARLLKYGKVRLARSVDPSNALARYPSGCSEDERHTVESMARSFVVIQFETNPIYLGREWAKYFWRHNYDLTTCFVARDQRSACPWDQERLAAILETNAGIVFEFLDRLTHGQRRDLYEPLKGEVLTGLVSRSLRLFAVLITDDALWASDTMRIFLRCLSESVITLAYLGKHGSDEEFRQFAAFGEGQSKLEMLHRQDSHPDAQALDGRTLTEMSEELGEFRAELLPIELDNWTKLTIRELAIAADIPEFARLVFAPTSGDVHGTWTSLKAANLTRCMEILHRGHRIPRMTAPAIEWEGLLVAHQLVQSAIEIARDTLGCPIDENLVPLPKIHGE